MFRSRNSSYLMSRSRPLAIFVAFVVLAVFLPSAARYSSGQIPPPDPTTTAAIAAAKRSHENLEIYFIDVEGGQATLFVTPDNKSLLVDTGWPGFEGRDAGRIVAVAQAAGIRKIDYALITHYHMDNVGGAPQLAQRIRIGTFIDHGENRESSDGPTTQVWQAYEKLLATVRREREIAKPEWP